MPYFTFFKKSVSKKKTNFCTDNVGMGQLIYYNVKINVGLSEVYGLENYRSAFNKNYINRFFETLRVIIAYFSTTLGAHTCCLFCLFEWF